MWMIGAMVCLLVAPWVQLSVSAGNGWPYNALRHHWLIPISCHFRDCKALLVTSLTHVSGAIASVRTFTFTFKREHVLLLCAVALPIRDRCITAVRKQTEKNARDVKSAPTRRSGASRIVNRVRRSSHHPLDLPVHRNAVIFELVRVLDHILLPQQFHDDTYNGSRVIAFTNEHTPTHPQTDTSENSTDFATLLVAENRRIDSLACKTVDQRALSNAIHIS